MPALRDLTAWVTAVCLAIVSVGFGYVPRARADGDDAVRVLVWASDGQSTAEARTAIESRGWVSVDGKRLRSEVEAATEAEVRRQAQRLREVDATLQKAQQAFLEQRWDAMADGLSALETSALDVLAVAPHCRTLWEVEFRRYLALQGRGKAGDRARAQTRLRFAAGLDPTRQPLREVYGPDVMQAYVEAVAAMQADPALPVTLEVAPSDARVRVDCVDVDVAKPIPLTPGLHVVHVSAPGNVPAAQVFEVGTATRLAVSAQESASPATEAWGISLAYGPFDSFGSSSAAALRRIVAHAVSQPGTKTAVRVEGDGEEFVAQAVDAASVGRRVEGRTALAAVTEALLDVDDRGDIRVVTPQLRASVTLATGRVTVKDRPVYKKPWLWVTVGVAVALAVGLGVGLGLGLQTEDPGPSRIKIFGPR